MYANIYLQHEKSDRKAKETEGELEKDRAGRPIGGKDGITMIGLV